MGEALRFMEPIQVLRACLKLEKIKISSPGIHYYMITLHLLVLGYLLQFSNCTILTYTTKRLISMIQNLSRKPWAFELQKITCQRFQHVFNIFWNVKPFLKIFLCLRGDIALYWKINSFPWGHFLDFLAWIVTLLKCHRQGFWSFFA